MSITITVPRLGWNMEIGTFVGWIKADGEAVRSGDAVFRLEGEKSVEEIESLDAGVLCLTPDSPKPGDRVAVGKVIGYLLQPGEKPVGVTPAPRKSEPAASPSVRRLARSEGVDLAKVRGSGPGGRVMADDLVRPRPSPSAATVIDVRPAISPRARRLAEKRGLDWSRLTGSGRTGRIRERDVASAVETSPPPASPQSTDGIAITPIRKTIAARMVESRQTTAPVTLTTTVNAANLVNLRNQYKAAGGVVPSYTDFLIKLAGAALRKHPAMTARWSDTAIIPAERIDIGLAVDTDAGLLVPVLRDVPTLGVGQIAAQALTLIEAARSGKLPARDMQGGCFTITNLGAFGIDAFTPIINAPECAILGVGRIQKRPAVVGDQIVPQEQVTLSLTFDHRVVDGAPAARFLQLLSQMIENPAPWLST